MPATPTIVFENGTMLGAMAAMSEQRKLQPPSAAFVIPEIVISASQSSNTLNRSRDDIAAAHAIAIEETPAECTALLEQPLQLQRGSEEDNEFEQFILNRTTSESNMLESSIYSELQFSAANSPAPPATQSAAAAAAAAAAVNTSACSRSDSRQSKRTRRKLHKSKSKCSSNVGVAVAVAGAGATTATTNVAPPVGSYPPQYAAIFLDQHQAAASPFLNASNPETAAANYLQYHQYYQQRPMGMAGLPHQHPHPHPHHHHLRRTLLDVAVPLAGGSGEVPANLASTNVNLNMSGVAAASGVLGSSELSGAPLGYSFRKWFARPSLPFVIGIFALGGVACTLGGIVLGSTGLIEHSTQYLSAALLMIGIGVSLLVISGAIWRLSLPDDVDDCPCFRRMETCRNCNSPHCTNRLLPGSYLYPEFQHRPPPPSYLTSLNEYAFVYHPGAHPQAAYATVRMNTPPPLYRSTYSLNTSTSHVLGGGVALPPTSEQPAEEQLTVLCTREAISQTSFKELEIDELHEEPPTREAESQTLFKEVELD
ncbi:hypothetical protein KR093_001520 [Drosophila rubida]|uniref:Uncharacterized protein n=1 Tax=Drosophila rubida TaxID=30044 RepID=A0AAD4JZS9_9MUSC|nr:hypothetical protein KR093_001520 [Drosophila rubida]